MNVTIHDKQIRTIYNVATIKDMEIINSKIRYVRLEGYALRQGNRFVSSPIDISKLTTSRLEIQF